MITDMQPGTGSVAIARVSERLRPVFHGWHRSLADRAVLSAVAFASAIVCVLSEPTIISPLFYYYPIFIYVGLKLAPRRLKWCPEIALGAFIALSAAAAIPFAPFFDRNMAATAFHAALTLLLFPLLFIGNVKHVFFALVPYQYLQAGWMAWEWIQQQWICGNCFRVNGFALNANAGSAFLLMGALFLMHQPRFKWLAVPLLLALPFSGSRWVLVVAITVMGLIFLSRRVPWRYLLVGIGMAFLLLFGFQHGQLQAAYRADRPTEQIIDNTSEDARWRLTAAAALATPWILVPQGFINSQIHNVPLRLATESGILSGVAWLAAGAICLYRRPRYTWAWWSMLTICLLSVMYYHTWIGPMGAFWWLLIAELTNHDKTAIQNG